MILYLAGGISGNMHPAWKSTKEATLEGFVGGLKSENFWQGGSVGTGFTLRL